MWMLKMRMMDFDYNMQRVAPFCFNQIIHYYRSLPDDRMYVCFVCTAPYTAGERHARKPSPTTECC